MRNQTLQKRLKKFLKEKKKDLEVNLRVFLTPESEYHVRFAQRRKKTRRNPYQSLRGKRIFRPPTACCSCGHARAIASLPDIPGEELARGPFVFLALLNVGSARATHADMF